LRVNDDKDAQRPADRNHHQPKEMIMSNISRRLLSASLFSLLTIAAVGSVSARSVYYPDHHPRREQVNDRLDRQSMRIDAKLRRGEISRREAAYLQARVNHIRDTERILASRNNGRLTARDQYILNRQQDRLSHRIGRM
jgi:hypothetical protein